MPSKKQRAKQKKQRQLKAKEEKKRNQEKGADVHGILLGKALIKKCEPTIGEQKGNGKEVTAIESEREEEKKKEQTGSEECHHGAPNDEVVCQAYEHAVQEYLQLSNQMNFDIHACTLAFLGKHLPLCKQEDFVKYTIARCATAVLLAPCHTEDRDWAWESEHRLCMLFALYLLYYVIPISLGEDVGPESENFVRCARYRTWLSTKRGFIRVIDKHIECDCLDTLGAKQMERMAMCRFCAEEVPRNEIWYCNGCKDTSYCGKECQTKDWELHKKDCTGYSKR